MRHTTSLCQQDSSTVAADFEALWKKQREAGHIPPPASENEHTNRIIAGEE
jgi:hypothetical protein